MQSPWFPIPQCPARPPLRVHFELNLLDALWVLEEGPFPPATDPALIVDLSTEAALDREPARVSD